MFQPGIQGATCVPSESQALKTVECHLLLSSTLNGPICGCHQHAT
jgi:hypothetical protein